jgi:hypothetical protein
MSWVAVGSPWRGRGCFATLCRPNSKNEKTGRKLIAIRALKNVKKRGRQAFERPFELGFGLCFQQNVQGVGSLAEERRQRDVKEIAKIAETAKN